MKQYPAKPITSPIDRLQKTVDRISLTNSRLVLCSLFDSYPAVELIRTKIGFKHPTVKYHYHAVRNPSIIDVNERISNKIFLLISMRM